MLQFFFKLIGIVTLLGDFVSAIMLSDCELNYCPSMNPASIVPYMQWRCYDKGTVLLSAKGQPILDICGNTVRAVGTWHAPINIEQCRLAISCGHENRNQDPLAKYCTPCDSWLAIDPEKIMLVVAFTEVNLSCGPLVISKTPKF